MELGDRELVNLALDGSESAAKQIVLRHRYVVMGVMRRFRTLTAADADDLFQEVFARLFAEDCAALRRWRGTDDLAAYVRTIARNLALDYLRERRSDLDTDPLQDEDAELASPDPSPETLALINQLRRMLLEAIQQLGPPHTEAIMLVDMQQLSYAEAAQRLEITPNHLGVRLHHARAALKRLIAQRYPALRAHFAPTAD